MNNNEHGNLFIICSLKIRKTMNNEQKITKVKSLKVLKNQRFDEIIKLLGQIQNPAYSCARSFYILRKHEEH